MRQFARLSLIVACLITVIAPAYAQTDWYPTELNSSAYYEPPPVIPAQPHTIAATAPREAGFWVIVGSVPVHDRAAWERSGREVRRKVAACGYQPFDDYSDKFRGFTPGYDVFVLGAFQKMEDAQQVLYAIQPCIDDAYIKYGEYHQ